MSQQLPVPAPPTATVPYGVQSPADRADTAQQIREQAAAFERAKPLPHHLSNGDEEVYEEKYGSYSKGLLHDQYGVVDRASYHALHRATKTGIPELFQVIPLGGTVKLVNPQSGLAFDLEGADSHALSIPPSPAVVSAERAAEMVELYWMAICRDVPFISYQAQAAIPGSPIARAIADLNQLGSAFKGPRQGGLVTAQTLFRGATPGETKGPYISQFFLQSAGFGDLSSPYDAAGMQGQLYYRYVDSKNYMTTWDMWRKVQNGQASNPTPNMPFGPNDYVMSGQAAVDICPAASKADGEKPTLQKIPFYLCTGRMGAAFVHVDELYQAYFMAALNLLDDMKFGTYDPNLPYQQSPSNATEAGFGTFGNPHVATLVAEVATRALKAQWFQKWFVHRTLRPEAYGGMVHAAMAKKNGDPAFTHAPDFPLHPSITESDAMDAVFHLKDQAGAPGKTWLLPMAFPEGSPQHPSYGSGHATVAGACATIIKAFFDEDMKFPCLVQANAAGDKLVAYTENDPVTGKPIELTIGEEANKIAGNVGMFRNHAGVHWRSDHEQSILLGEQIAISILQDQKYLYNEPFAGWTFTMFNGTKITI